MVALGHEDGRIEHIVKRTPRFSSSISLATPPRLKSADKKIEARNRAADGTNAAERVRIRSRVPLRRAEPSMVGGAER
jgi:hypothetical protein